MSTIAYMLPGATEADDCYLYPSKAPPQSRPDTQRSPVQSPSYLCEGCSGVLEYLAYMLEEKWSGRSTIKDLDLALGAIHYQNLSVWLETTNNDFHLCYFLCSHLRGPREMLSCPGDVQVEFSWGSEMLGKEKQDLQRGRLCVALTRPSLPRTEANYFTFMRFQTWPAKDYAGLFLALSNPQAVSRSPSHSDNGSQDADDLDARSHDKPNDVPPDANSNSPSSEVSSGGDKGYRSDGNNSDASNTLPARGSESNDGDFDSSDSHENGSADNISDGHGFDDSDHNDNDSGSDRSDDGSDEDHQNGRRVVMSAGSTGSQFSQKLVAQWLARCLSNEDGEHTECNRAGNHWLPTRLIDVNYSTDNPMLRLVSPAKTPDIFDSDKRFITLSHCWGEWGPKELPVLKLSNECDRFDVGIGLAELPPTFQDAIEVVHWLGVRWLWIDSLCIIQDSTEDWQREALLMHDVYKQGFLNIAATTALDARGGLFKPRSPKAFQPLELYMPGIDQALFLTVDERDMFEWMESEPLSGRAWVFQERHPARRILHFTNTEIFWECCAKAPYFASETFARGAPLRSIFNSKPKLQIESVLQQSSSPAEEVYDLWEDVCQMYSEKHLSYQGDKIIALQGLANEFIELLPSDKYLAGPHQFTVGDSSFQPHPAISYSLDNKIETKITEAYFLFLTWIEDRESGPRFRTSGLLLQPASEPNTFTRCGTLHLNGYGAVAAKYQVKEDVGDRVDAWNSFNGWLKSRCGSISRMDKLPETAHSPLGGSATDGLYDYNWIADNDKIEMLKPQKIVLI
ncbi:MAG: hypothetical protein Q9168_002757 [Polycauliona sp. 1 TL-2023]